ncbi:MAG TPA: signal peptidase II [Anaerolineae bacterium]|nr:signal peptidase II [Anaerolineae bacterium]HRT31405.1 signal peptidase II [Anaerolineae bacterium]HRU95300.1 signal peptidase II [Anaerolineae bacterium]
MRRWRLYPSRLVLWGLAAIIILADRLSKAWVLAHLTEYVPADVFPWLAPIASFTRLPNTGVAFGMFPQFGDIFKILSAGVIVAIIFFSRSLDPHDWFTHVALGFMVGGATGNLIDRLIYGYVVDFIDLNFWPFRSFAVFNLADASIVIGVGLLLVVVWVQERRAAHVNRAENPDS